MNRFAATIDLSGPLLRESLRALRTLRERFNVSYIEKHSYLPHIALSFGCCKNFTHILSVMKNTSKTLSPFYISSNGLGVFIKSYPVLFIRWFTPHTLRTLHATLEHELAPVWADTDITATTEGWIPKTTLAFRDLSYDMLPQVIKTLQDYDFEQSLLVDSLTLVQIHGTTEEVIERTVFAGIDPRTK